MNITPAILSEARALTEIAHAAKRHWGYPAHWIEQWREALTITPEFIAAHHTCVAREAQRITGFYALCRDAGTLCLEHLWVLPDQMGRGVGRALFCHALQQAGEMGFQFFEVESDPRAAGFYERMGAERIGTTLATIDGQCRELPVLRCGTMVRPPDGHA